MDSVFFYISGHGFGHAVRQIEIVNALAEACGGALQIVVRTDASRWLFERTASAAFELIPGATDTGVVQIDALHLDERATIETAARFYAGAEGRIDAERALMVRHRAALVVCDAPPLPCAAARAAGVPAFVCSNFTWDWIYQAYEPASPRAREVVAAAADLYGHAAGAWRLPMHGGFGAFADVVDVPLVARRPRPDLSRDALRRALGLPEERRLALVSFGGFGVQDLPLGRLDCTAEWIVVLTARGEAPAGLPRGVMTVREEALYSSGLRYEDLVRAMDVVVSKPGYGIISDCVASGTALLYTPRGRFPEYDVLVRQMPGFLRCRLLSMEDFLAGRWRASLDALAAMAPPAGTPRTDGAHHVARLILEAVRGGPGAAEPST